MLTCVVVKKLLNKPLAQDVNFCNERIPSLGFGIRLGIRDSLTGDSGFVFYFSFGDSGFANLLL